MVRKQKIISSCKIPLIFLSLTFLTACRAYSDDTPDLRQPNDNEILYHYAAVSVNEPELCAKISPNAYLSAGWTQKGYQISLERSECYYDVAIRFAREDLCEKVKPINQGSLDGSQYSPSPCREKIRKNGPDDSSGNDLPSNDKLVTIFSQMGYTPAVVIEQKLTRNPLNLFDVYAKLGEEKDILERIKAVTDSPDMNRVTIEQLEILYDLAAHKTNDVHWCEKIREDVLRPDSHYGENTSHEFSRDWCIFEVACNAKDTSLCQSMPERPRIKDRFFTLKESCAHQITESLKFKDNKSHYGYFLPRDEEIIASILKILNYPLPDFKDLSQDEIHKIYSDFLLELTYPEKDDSFNPPSFLYKEIYKTAREEFIRRVKTLPDF